MPIIFNMVTLLPPHCPVGFQLSVVDFKQCLEGCWDHRRLSEQSCLTLHQLELSQTWDKEKSLPSFPLPCFISAPSRAKAEAHLPSLKIHAQPFFVFQLCWLLVHSQWPPGPVICGAQLIQLYANHQACPSCGSSKFKFAYHKKWRKGWEMGFSSEELEGFVSAATGWNIKMKTAYLLHCHWLQQWQQNCPFSLWAGFPESKGE